MFATREHLADAFDAIDLDSILLHLYYVFLLLITNLSLSFHAIFRHVCTNKDYQNYRLFYYNFFEFYLKLNIFQLYLCKFFFNIVKFIIFFNNLHKTNKQYIHIMRNVLSKTNILNLLICLSISKSSRDKLIS